MVIEIEMDSNPTKVFKNNIQIIKHNWYFGTS